MLVDGSTRVNWLGYCFDGKERGCEKACSRAISEGTQNAWTEQRGQAAILAGKR